MRRLLLALALLVLLAAGVSAQTTDNVSIETQTRNEFPRALIFEISATSDEELTSVRLFFRPAGTSFWSSQPIDIEPGTSISAEYEWFTENQILPPNLLLEYRWRVQTADGDIIETDLQQVEFTDTRFNWYRHTNEKLTLLWHAGDQTWGEEMFSTAQQAMTEIEGDLGVTLEQPIRIVVYEDKDAFQGAFPPQEAWIGGQAFPSMSISVQIIDAGNSEWMSRVISHEISHLVFHRATEEALATPPSWFTEGLARYHEPGEFDDDQLNTLRNAAQNGEILPLSRLQGNFGADHGAVTIAYTQSAGMVDYLIRDCGKDGLHTIIEQLNDDRSFDEALETACDYTQEELYDRWLEQQLGVSPAQSEPPADTQSQPTDEPTPGQQQSSSTDSFGGVRVYLLLGIVAVGAGLVALVAGGLAVALALKR